MSVMSQDQTWQGPVALSTGFSEEPRAPPRLRGMTGRACWSSYPAAIRHHERLEASSTPLGPAAVVPGGGEGMVNGVALLPAGQDEPQDPVLMRGADPGFVGPVGLVDRVLHRRTGIGPVMPGPARHARQLERRPLGADDHMQLQDQSVLGRYEPF